MAEILKYTLTETDPTKIKLPEGTTFIKLKAKKDKLYFYGLSEWHTQQTIKTFQILKTANEIKSVNKKAYLGSCKHEGQNLYLFEV